MRARWLGVLVALPLVVAAPTNVLAQVAIPPMLGPWQGDAQIVVSWMKQRTLPVRISIHADDRVTGTIGEATLVNGLLLRNHEEIAHTMRWQGEYLIDANLTGAIVRADNVWRTSVQLVLTWRDDRFQGGLSTSGWKVAGSERRVIDASVTLRRAPIRIVCQLSPSLFDP